MPLVTYLKPETAMILHSTTRDGVLDEMIRKMCRTRPSLRPDDVRAAVDRREDELNTRVAPGIALPHARIAGMDGFLMTPSPSEANAAHEPIQSPPERPQRVSEIPACFSADPLDGPPDLFGRGPQNGTIPALQDGSARVGGIAALNPFR